MPTRSRRLAALFATASIALATVLAFAAPAQADGTTIQLLTINDFHGRIAEDPTATPKIPGAAKLIGLANSLRGQMPTALVAAGDLIGASTFPSAIAQDTPTLDVMNAAGLNVSAVGNHEFDQGFADLHDRVEPYADFPYLGANIYLDGEHALDSYAVQEIGGLRVGFIGVVTLQTPQLVSPAGIAGLTFTDPVLEADKVAAQLKDGDESNGEADIVVLLAHEGASEDSVQGGCLGVYDDSVFTEFTHASAAIDAIVSGHTHESYAYEMPVPGMAKTRPIIQANHYSEALGKITLTYDGHTVTSSTAELLDPEGATPDPGIATIVAGAVSQSATLGAQPVGSITADFPPEPAARDTDNPTANLVSTAQYAATTDPGRGGAQLAFTNPGGVRAGLAYAQSGTEGNGVVTYSEADTVQPFANDVVTISLTGARIKQALAQQVQPLGGSRILLYLGVSSNFAYSYRYTPTAGGVQGTLIVDSATISGVLMDDATSYRVTMNSFLAAGGDNFTAFAQGIDSFTTGDNDLVMLNDYMTAHPDLSPGEFGPFGTLTGPAPSSGPIVVAPPAASLTPQDCPAPVASAAVSLSTAAAHPGDTIHVLGTDFAPYETVTAALYSEPLAVGSSVASADGTVEFDVVLSAAIAPGDHSVRLVGLGSDIDISAALTVEALLELAATGGRDQQGLMLGLGLLLLGCAALLAGRRRPRLL
jgi:5'-nucleotidase